MAQAQALPILMYHHVSPSPGLVTVSPATFRAHVAALSESGWRAVGLAEVERFFAGEALPEKSCVISFDDGYLDNYAYAHPALAEFGQCAVLFVVTGWLGDGPRRDGSGLASGHAECMYRVAAGKADEVMLRWSEVEAMRAAGTFEFHSHSHTHTRWDRQVTDAEAREAMLAEDLASSRRLLGERLGTCSRHLCWPQGYYDAGYVRAAASAGFDHLYTTERRINTPTASPLAIGRVVAKERPGIWVQRRTALYARPWLGGLYAWLHGQERRA